jgi:hypothetical protein
MGRRGGRGSRMEAAPMGVGGDVVNVAMERLFEGRRLKTLDDGAGGHRIRWAAAAAGGVDGGVWDRRLWQLWRWGGSGAEAEGRDGR